MTNPELTHQHLLDQLHQQTAREAREKVMKYISGELVPRLLGGYDADDEEPESKNV